MSTMAVDNRQQGLLNGIPYEPRYQAPHFTNPWGAATSGAASTQMYAASLAPPSSTAALASTPQHHQQQQQQQQQQQPQQQQRLQYPGSAVSAAPLATGSVIPAVDMVGQLDLLAAPQDRLNTSAAYGTQYTTSSAPSAYAPHSSAAYGLDYTNRAAAAAASYGFADPARRPSHPSVASAPYFDFSEGVGRKDSVVDIEGRLNNEEQRNSFNEALEASRGMVSMSQSDITPRNIYGNPGDRSSVSSYGFPSTHSAHSSISGSSYAPSYYGSVDSSVTDYSSASESVDLNSRTLPRPSNLIGGAVPPAPQSMMGQFSSKVASSSQKKHKCKICDKRFTRPSSLQTHMYSHTGEKPFACEVEGCGRHFSVVSNLRRHRKVHKNDGDHTDDHPSPDD